MCLRAEKTPFEPDLDHTSVGKYVRLSAISHRKPPVERVAISNAFIATNGALKTED